MVQASSASSLSAPPPAIEVPEAFDFLFTRHGDYRYRAAHGGRGSGKSHAFATALVIKARQQPLRILCCREIQKSIKDSVKRLLDDKIEACGFGGFFQSLETEIRGANGSLFVFAGLRTNPETIKSGEGYDIAWIEEATNVSERSLTILRPTLRSDDAEIWATWNPELPTAPIDKLLRSEVRPPRSIVREVNFEDNPFFTRTLREEMEWDKSRDPEKYQWVWRGAYRRNSEARVFRNWRVEPFDTPTNARFYHGADWGFSVDPTVLVRCHIEGRTLYVDHEAYKVGCEIDHTPALFDGLVNSEPKAARKWPIVADSSNPQAISYLNRNGYPTIKPSIKGANSVREGVEFLRTFDIVVHPRCKHTIDELTLYSFKTDPLTGDVLPVLEDNKNHVIDALRYAVEGVRRAGPVAASGTFVRR